MRIDAIVDRLDGYLSRNSEDGAFHNRDIAAAGMKYLVMSAYIA